VLPDDREPTSETSCFFKKLDDKVQKKKNVSVNFIHALFSLTSAHDNLGMQAWLGSAWPGSE
jgi:hypothetical protein